MCGRERARSRESESAKARESIDARTNPAFWEGKSRGRKRMRGRQQRKSSIRKDFGGEVDGTRLDTVTKEFLVLIEFKRTQDARSNYAELSIMVAQNQ